ncbi:unnamed protein product [Leuciscus chuanchicus]
MQGSGCGSTRDFSNDLGSAGSTLYKKRISISFHCHLVSNQSAGLECSLLTNRTLVCGDKDSLLLILSRKGRKCEVKTLLFHKQQSSDPGLGEDPVYHSAEQSGAEKERKREREEGP